MSIVYVKYCSIVLRKCRVWVHFVCVGVECSYKKCHQRKAYAFDVIQVKRPINVFFIAYSLNLNMNKLTTFSLLVKKGTRYKNYIYLRHGKLKKKQQKASCF